MKKKLKMYSLFSRKSLVDVAKFASVLPPSKETARFIESFPDIYAGNDLKDLINVIVKAHRNGKPVIAAFGGHLVKCGLGPLINDLIERKVITGVAMNGGASIHDYEIALAGQTSEDVAASLKDGAFGMARETVDAYAKCVKTGARKGNGLGKALGSYINKEKHQFRKYSILAAAAAAGIPGTVHVAMGTDIVHMHPSVSPAHVGQSTMNDFDRLSDLVSHLEGGVWLNIGSAVLLPEIFLKALSMARNRGHRLKKFTTANLDMIQHYRPTVNVLERPGGKAIAITGRHEILIPLLHAGVVAQLAFRKGARS